MVKLMIDPGHGGHDPGAGAYGLKEKNLTLDISKRIKKYLERNYKGVEVRLTRSTDVFVGLTQRANKGNSWGADFFMSVHINAAGGNGSGFESYVYNGNITPHTSLMRNYIHNEIISETGERNRGKKRANFAVLRQSKMPAILTESFFVDNKREANLLKQSSFLDKIAKGHAVGFAKAYNLKGGSASSGTSTIAPTPTKKPSSTIKKPTGGSLGLVDYLKSKKIDSSYSNREKLAAKHGIKNYSGLGSQNTALLNKIKAGNTVTDSNDSYVGKRVQSKVDSLNFYNKATWKNPAGKVSKGYGFPTILSKLKVGKGYQYKVKNSKGNVYYITASSKYVEVVGSSTTASKSKTSFKTGSTVTLKNSAKTFATGQSILSNVKGKKYKIIQTKKDRVLLGGIMSWVKKSDIY